MDEEMYNEQNAAGMFEAEEVETDQGSRREPKQRERHKTNNWLKIGAIINIIGSLSFLIFLGLSFVMSELEMFQESGSSSEDSSSGFSVSVSVGSDWASTGVRILCVVSVLVLILSIILLTAKNKGTRIGISVFLTLISFADLFVFITTMGAVLFCCTTWYLLIPPASHILGSILCLMGCFVRSV